MISKVPDFQIHIRGFDSLCLLISVFSTYISFNLEYATFYIFPISIIASTTLPFFLKTFTARFLSTPSCFTIKSMSSFIKPSSLSEISPNARKRALLNSMLWILSLVTILPLWISFNLDTGMPTQCEIICKIASPFSVDGTLSSCLTLLCLIIIATLFPIKVFSDLHVSSCFNRLWWTWFIVSSCCEHSKVPSPSSFFWTLQTKQLLMVLVDVML